MGRTKELFLAAVPSMVTAFTAVPSGAQSIQISIQGDAPSLISDFEIGVAHVNGGWQNGDPQAVSQAESHLSQLPLHNIHIMGWGLGNPEPSLGVYDWASLDAHMEMFASMGVVPMITLATAPGWMKPSGEDWNMQDRVAREHEQDFANLSGRIAQRYPQVQYYQIWNEMKGYWSNDLGTYDYYEYTRLYNLVYGALKSANPNAKIGGPYLNLAGNGVHDKVEEILDYWLTNADGADFVACSGWSTGWPPNTAGDKPLKMQNSAYFGQVTAAIRNLTELPVWIVEMYGGMTFEDPQFTATSHASSYLHALLNGTQNAIHWDPLDFGALITPTDVPAGGQPLPHLEAISMFHQHFGRGIEIYASEASSPEVESLVSAQKILLINKSPNSVTVDLEGTQITMAGYSHVLADTPAGAVAVRGDAPTDPTMDAAGGVPSAGVPLGGNLAGSPGGNTAQPGADAQFGTGGMASTDSSPGSLTTVAAHGSNGCAVRPLSQRRSWAWLLAALAAALAGVRRQSLPK